MSNLLFITVLLATLGLMAYNPLVGFICFILLLVAKMVSRKALFATLGIAAYLVLLFLAPLPMVLVTVGFGGLTYACNGA